ncbi:tyrosine-protein phosphatase non-receptor type 14 [Anopheles bellator]|uniref:tyrosine-protein phosphatase non-receptor type 14 n=1 Tax=Anopheles bellator TaxID=139047 RepID=UPI00264A2504|nr:tyrosine-protein phosphatase non-receptor type 14 [Anopheles bellator]
MPFKLKLKKSRHYNVMSKSLFVISVDHLDSSTKIDCTLSSESTGQECLENVCQRISIQQPEFFGLRYVVKGTNDELRWVDLERPLSRQLEKYSANSKVLHLRVMYYVLSGVSLLKDEGTRNYYFLQLKHDVVEGRISCDPRQAVILANYSRQAEYGNHQDRHTVDYLKTLLAFPQEMVQANLLEALTEQVIQQAHELHNCPQGDAEESYISACQQLDGYGQETFMAKNESGVEVTLGISVSGIIVASEENRFYPWRDITNVVNHKRVFNIECTVARESSGFTVADVATGRYIWKLCALQHRFFVTYEQNQAQASQMNLNLFQNMGDNLNDSRDDLLHEPQYHAAAATAVYQSGSGGWPSHASSMWNGAPSGTTIIETQPGGGSGLMSSSSTSIAHGVGGSIGNLNANPGSMMQTSRTSLQASALDINLNSGYANQMGSATWGLPINPAGGSNTSLINRAQSSSCLDLSNNNLTPDRERLKALLPTYRPAPDYETAIQQKYRSSSNDVRLLNGSLLHLSASQMPISDPTGHPQQTGHHQLDYSVSGSQPDVSYYGQHLQQQQQQPYPDVTHHTTAHHVIGPHYSDASDYGLTHRFKMMRLVKPPPPYPANRLSSTSTPDLASHRALLGLRSAQVSGSSPDLVSSRPLLNHLHHAAPPHQLMHLSHSGHMWHPGMGGTGPHQLHHSQTMLPHGTYENLNFIETNSNPPGPGGGHLSSGSQPTGKVFYYVPGGVEHLLLSNSASGSGGESQSPYHAASSAPPVPIANGHIGLASKVHLNRSSQQINGSIEPIYENVPLPWMSETAEPISAPISVRSRTSSVPRGPRPIPTPPQPQTPSGTNAPTSTAPVAAAMAAEGNRQPSPGALQSMLQAKINEGAPPTVINRSLSSNNVLDSSQYSSYTLNETAQSGSVGISGRINGGHNDSGISSITAGSTNLGGSGGSRTSITTTNTVGANSASTSSRNVTLAANASSVSASSSVKETKRRRLWEILGGGRSKHSADKQKSATLGREKDRKKKGSMEVATNSSTASASSGDGSSESGGGQLRHRWSTGLPRLQPLPANISKEKLCSLLESKLAEPQLFCEFERIPKRSDSATYTCALAEENKNKNSNPTFLPYDNNRVRLTPMRDNRVGYVNASHITSTVGNKQRFYIVAESPHDKVTTHIFWQCVWEADVYLLVQLSKELIYIPQTSERCLEYGQYQVWREFSQETDRCTTSKLRVYHTQSRRYRSVWHLSYTEWADQNCPADVGHFLGFLEELNSVRLASNGEVPPSHNTNPPVLIHCNEGGGRTGVTLVADLLLYTLDHNQDIDIPRLIGQIRQQRDNIIPSLAQYKFIHALLIHYLKQNRLI